MTWHDDSAFEDNYDLDDEDLDDYFGDCGWTPSDGCSMAGSEDCDFECPYRDDMIAELTGKRRVKP